MAPIERDDLYAALGVEPEAGAEAIKAAYRTLARENHPDLSARKDAAEVFQRLTAAYAVLSSPVRRAAYDRLRRTTGRGAAPLRPLQCSECGRTTAQPRILTFRSVRSLLFRSRTICTEGVYCVACARGAALKASADAFVRGWWAVPMGPPLTIAAIFQNAFAASRGADSDQSLLLFNAEAFLAQDNPQLAYALAAKVQARTDGALQRKATAVIAAARARAPAAGDLRLRDPWRLQVADLALHTLMAAGPPLGLAALLLV